MRFVMKCESTKDLARHVPIRWRLGIGSIRMCVVTRTLDERNGQQKHSVAGS